MAATEQFRGSTTDDNFRYLSSLADDVWHPAGRRAGAYEWWYFDAVSDDGRDAVVVIFLADFIFSPRFNRAAAAAALGAGGAHDPTQFPAVAVCLYRRGRLFARAVNEYTAGDFAARADQPECRIGRSRFLLEKGGGASRYLVELDEALRGGRRLTAELEWTVVEGDLCGGREGASRPAEAGAHVWNLAAPRCRVIGRIRIEGGNSAVTEEFGGTGYHDHNRDRRWMPATVREWQWGRAHFDDTTVVFYRYSEAGAAAPATRLFVIRDGALSAHPARLTELGRRRHGFGLRYARDLLLEGGGVSLRVEQHRVVDASYFYLRFLGEAALDAGKGQGVRRAPAITEHLAPRALRWRWLDWLTDMRIGRNGRASFLS